MKTIIPNWPAPPNIHAFTTTKQSYSGGSLTDEKNQTFKTLFSLPAEPIWLQQTHSAIALPALLQNRNKQADASFSRDKSQICVVSTADCLPILICNREGNEVAAIHAGWRGLASNIIENTVNELSNPEECLAWLGPAIGPNKFEVGLDVYEAFVKKNPDHGNAFNSLTSDKWLANLYQIATLQLKSVGINAIYGGDFCTYSQDDLFYSYRRDKGLKGRMASLIWFS